MLPHDQLSENRLKLEPKNIEKNSVQLIMAYDLAGWKQGQIADMVGLTQSRVCIIMNSPLYKNVRNVRFRELQDQVVGGKVNEALRGDPIQRTLKELAGEAIDEKERLLTGAKNEFVRNAVSSDILDRAGYKGESKKIRTSIEVTEKMADRFERVLKMGSQTVKIKVETEE